MTQAERDALAKELAALQGAASQADGAAGQALKDAASSLAQGDTGGRQGGPEPPRRGTGRGRHPGADQP